MKVKERHFESSNVQLYFPTKNKKDHLRKLDPDAGATFLWWRRIIGCDEGGEGGHQFNFLDDTKNKENVNLTSECQSDLHLIRF